MKITINQEEIEFTLENEKTIGEVLNAIEQSCEESNGTIVHIIADKRTIPVDSIDEFSKKEISEVELLEIDALFLIDIKNAFADINCRLDEINPQLGELPVLLQSGKDIIASSVLKNFADIFDAICHVTTAAALFPDFINNLLIDGKSLPDFLKEFSPLLADFENAIKDKDTVLTGDLAEYELKPKLELLANSIRNL